MDNATRRAIKIHRQAKQLKRLLWSKKRWAQGDYALDVSKEPVPALGKKATCFCLMGALYRLRAADLTAFIKDTEQLSLIRFNDAKSTTHADIKRFLTQLVTVTALDVKLAKLREQSIASREKLKKIVERK